MTGQIVLTAGDPPLGERSADAIKGGCESGCEL